jgi:hypothetical protein
MSDPVNHPPHYTFGKHEPIDVIEDWKLSFCLGNVVKYIARAGRKNNDRLEDLKKAQWYLNREIEQQERAGSKRRKLVDRLREQGEAGAGRTRHGPHSR